MNLRRCWWNWIGPAMCLQGALVLAQDEPRQVPVEAAGDVLFFVSNDGEPQATGESKKPAATAEPPGQSQDAQRAVNYRVLAGAALQAHIDSEPPGKYWVGLLCIEPGEALRVQLDLPAGVGLLVQDVTEGGPAMKAGIQRHDLLLSVTIANKAAAEPQQLKTLSDLVQQIQVAEKAPVKIEFLRRGRKQTLELVPEERPKTPPQYNPVAVIEEGERVLRAFPGGPSGGAGSGSVALRWAGPMVVQAAPPLPDGVSIDVQAVAGQPEKLTVKKGDQTWVVTAAELDKLPEDLRAIVSQQLAARRAAAAGPNAVFGFSGGGGGAVRALVVHGPGIVLPADVTVTVVRHGAEPAKVNVKKGDQSWDATDKDLAKLPDEIRPFAEWSLVGHASPMVPSYRAVTTPVPPTRQRITKWAESQPGGLAPVHPPHAEERSLPRTNVIIRHPDSVQHDIERQLKELTEQVEKLKLAVEKQSQLKQ